MQTGETRGLGGREGEGVEVDPPLLEVDAPAEGVLQGLRLLVDLLEHEVLVAALLGLDGIPGKVVGGALDRRPGAVDDRDRAAPQARHVAVLEEDDVPGVGEQRGRVGGEEPLVGRDAEHQRRAAARRDDLLVGGERDGSEGVHPLELGDGALHRGKQIARAVPEVVREQVGDHFGVGVGGEGPALGLQAALERQEVLDDPVVDHRDAPAQALVGVGVERPLGAAVGRPAGVAEAEAAGERLPGELLGQPVELALGADGLEAALAHHGDARRVVAAVLEPAQAVDEPRHDVARADVSDDSTHGATPCRFARSAAGDPPSRDRCAARSARRRGRPRARPW